MEHARKQNSAIGDEDVQVTPSKLSLEDVASLLRKRADSKYTKVNLQS